MIGEDHDVICPVCNCPSSRVLRRRGNLRVVQRQRECENSNCRATFWAASFGFRDAQIVELSIDGFEDASQLGFVKIRENGRRQSFVFDNGSVVIVDGQPAGLDDLLPGLLVEALTAVRGVVAVVEVVSTGGTR